MEYEKCYVFEPEEPRPAKRRRTEQQGLHASWSLRKKAYQNAWRLPQQRIDEKLESINAATVADVVTFLDESISAPPSDRIPTALVLAGPDSALRSSIALQVAAQSTEGARRIFVSIASNAGSNLKGALKAIIQKATSRVLEDDDEEELEVQTSSKKGPKLLNYDLQALYDYVQEHRIQQVVIAFEDTEAFDNHLLSELIEILSCWQSRIPFACLLNVATSVDFLQQRLSTQAVGCFSGRLFDAALSGEEIEQVFDALTESGVPLYLGSSLMPSILDRQTDYFQSIDSFVQAAQYAYMSHYYANALSVFLDPACKYNEISQDHFEALRNLPSFRNHAKQLLDENHTKEVRKLLDMNQTLFDFTQNSIVGGRSTIAAILVSTGVFRTLQRCLSTNVSSKSNLYIQAMSGRLEASPLVRSVLLSLRKASSDVAFHTIQELIAIGQLPEGVTANLTNISDELSELIEAQGDSTKPLRSEDDVKNSTLRTTVIAQKVELSKQKSTLSKQDAAYTTLVRRLSDALERYFEISLVDPKTLPMHEIFIYDLKSPFRDVFTPRPRAAVERALAAPHDYLDCSCCGSTADEEATLASSQPATAILYQLYLESGSLVNAHDLWQAFQAVISDKEDDEQRTMALFQRALADLRYLGFVKSTRKRVDHIAKVAWKGL